MKESLANALNSKNLRQTEQPSAIDKVHALGSASIYISIGADAVHFIDAMQSKSYKQLLCALMKTVNGKYRITRSMNKKICELVIYEAAFTQCKSCNGAREIAVKDHVITCQTCKGVGLHRHTDLERSVALEMSLETYLKGWVKRFEYAQAIFSGKYSNTLKLTAKKYHDYT